MALKKATKTVARLGATQVHWTLAEDAPVPETTTGVESKHAVLGQDRAHRALKMGLEVYHPGYNVFVSGLSGIGKTLTVKRVLKSLNPSCRLSSDLCYVHNFEEPDRPLLLQLGRGEGTRFKDAVHDTIKSLGTEIRAITESDEARRRKERIRDRFQKRSIEVATDFKDTLEAAGFVLGQIQAGVQTVPELLFMVGEEPVRVAELDDYLKQGAIDEATVAKAKENYGIFASQLAEVVASQQGIAQNFQTAITESDREAVSLSLEGFLRALGRRFPGDDVAAWMKQVKDAILENLESFTGPPTPAPAEGAENEGPPPEPIAPEEYPVFDVNVILNNKTGACPVIIENYPTYVNLFGSQERFPLSSGGMGTDFTRIKAGSLVRAQGGYLIMNAEDILIDPTVWGAMKRALRSRELSIQPPESPGSSGGPILNPQPIELEVKVVLVGSHHLFNALAERDMDFAKIFKVKADFDATVAVDDQSVADFADIIIRILRDDKLRDMDRSAIEVTMQRSMRDAGRRGRFSTRFSRTADILREADYFAGQAGADVIRGEHVKLALSERRYRGSLYEELLTRQVVEGDVFIDVDGKKIGQINGLTVMSTGDHSFGKPARISCRTGVGKAGFINVEREVELTGTTFEKALLIIQGFFTGRYADLHALTFSASISFEQSYSYIDGDSASSTEIYVLVSSLAGIPLRQDLAVTGSVDQFGRIQPVGGVNEKIEGFFDTCVALGLTGQQGCLIPDSVN